MTKYAILIIADKMNPPVTYQEGGVVEADTKKQAVEMNYGAGPANVVRQDDR